MKKLFKANHDIFLLSASPRRQDFFHDLGFDFSVIEPTEKESSPYENELASDYAMRVAEQKAIYGLKTIDKTHKDKAYVIIAADTVVSIDKQILGKPKDSDDAFRMLKMLSGKTHTVTTGVHILEQVKASNSITFASSTEVTFFDWCDEVLKAYATCGEPFDKAGAYAIQGKGAFLVSSIAGSWSNVVGLPVTDIVNILLKNSSISSL